MTELMEMALELVAMEAENELLSKIEGRRNWVIRVETIQNKRVIIYHGGYGKARALGALECFVKDIGKYQVRWYTFTYKKDYEKTLEKLHASGITGFWEK